MRHVLEDRRGSAAVEFALIAPIMLLLYFGMADITQGLLANRRAGHVTTAIGDLVAQSSSLKQSQIEDIFDLAAPLMNPMQTATLSIRVTSVSIDANKAATVAWSQARGDNLAALGQGTTATGVPTAMALPGESLVRADTKYIYTSPLQKALPNPITFEHTVWLKPRSAAVLRTTG